MAENAVNSMDIHEILEHLPHRYPFVLVDRVLSMELGKEIVAVKNVSVNEPYFPGHFPYHPVMPGVLKASHMRRVATSTSSGCRSSMAAKPASSPSV